MWPDVQEPPECVTQGKALFSGPQFPHLQNGALDGPSYSLSLARTVGPPKKKPILWLVQP